MSDRIKDGAYVINFDEYPDIGTLCIALYVNTKTVTYFDSFGVEHIPKEIKQFNDNINKTTKKKKQKKKRPYNFKLFSNQSLKISECNPILDNQQFRLNKINEIKDYFLAEIKERELMSKRLSKHIVAFDYFYKSLIVLSATSRSISIISFATVIGTPVGIASASLSLAFSLSTELVKKLLKITKERNIIKLLC